MTTPTPTAPPINIGAIVDYLFDLHDNHQIPIMEESRRALKRAVGWSDGR